MLNTSNHQVDPLSSGLALLGCLWKDFYPFTMDNTFRVNLPAVFESLMNPTTHKQCLYHTVVLRRQKLECHASYDMCSYVSWENEPSSGE